jgi:hypothetical protein
MIKHILFKTIRVLSAIGALLSASMLIAGEHGNGQCSNATLKGSYGLHATGTIIGIGDFAAIGRFTFDGKGNLTGKLFVRVNGNNLEPPEFTGTYSVNPDCTVSDSWGGSSHVSVIVNEGKEYFILNNTSGEGDTISGEAKKQFPD